MPPAHQTCCFKQEMHQSYFWSWLFPGPFRGAYDAPPVDWRGYNLSPFLSPFTPAASRCLTSYSLRSPPLQISVYVTTRYTPPVKKFWVRHCLWYINVRM